MPLETVDDLREKISTEAGAATTFNVLKLRDLGYDVDRIPYSVRVLLENAARNSRSPGGLQAVHSLASWPSSVGDEMPFFPYRVLLQDYTGVPLIVDLAAMRDAAKSAGLDPRLVDSKVPVDLVIDHSVQVDAWGNELAYSVNLSKEYERNSERYSLLKWARSSFKGLRVFPPGKGICHQVNLEYLSSVVVASPSAAGLQVFPDTLLGTDSHTPMANGLGVLGWGVGGIEAEAVMMGEPYHMPVPEVLGVRLSGQLGEGVTPTDLVLTLTERLRQKNLVGAFVEYFGEGLTALSVPDRATIANMSPEYGATVGFSPVDEATLAYMRWTGRSPSHVDLVRRYCLATGFFASGPEPKYSDVMDVDLGDIEPSVSGPRNPEERTSLRLLPSAARATLEAHEKSRSSAPRVGAPATGSQILLTRPASPQGRLEDGSVVIAAITSCTNTSNPTVMVGAGLLARKAVELGLSPKPWVKQSFAPGSTVVTDYLGKAGLLQHLQTLGFDVVGFGCTTCIGNSGPLSPEVESAVKEGDLYTVAVLSGNRNFDGRIHPLVKGSYLMSPMLVVAFALAGTIEFDFNTTPLGTDQRGRPVFLRDVWPTLQEIREAVERSVSPELYTKRYADMDQGDERWASLPSGAGDVYAWQEESTYIRRPPWFDPTLMKGGMRDVLGARVLAVLGDKVTTDHISPAGTIPVDSPAGSFLLGQGVDMLHFSSYGSRRGNHQVMVRGGFSNSRLGNSLAPGREGGWTTHLPSGTPMSVYGASVRYSEEETPLLVIAGKQYGTGSSRDWAAKAPRLLGVRAVLAESFERIHRSNLVAMGVLPLQFVEGEDAESLGISGRETFDVLGISSLSRPKQRATVVARDGASEKRFEVMVRVDNEVELSYLRSGGVLPYIISRMNKSVH